MPRLAGRDETAGEISLVGGVRQVNMASTCGICGQFASQTAKRTLVIRGMDRRGGCEKVETGELDVSAGDCCGLVNIEDRSRDGPNRPYQSYLNQAQEGELRFVVLVRGETQSATVEYVGNPGCETAPASMRETEIEGPEWSPITGNSLPDSVDEWVVGKFD